MIQPKFSKALRPACRRHFRWIISCSSTIIIHLSCLLSRQGQIALSTSSSWSVIDNCWLFSCFSAIEPAASVSSHHIHTAANSQLYSESHVSCISCMLAFRHVAVCSLCLCHYHAVLSWLGINIELISSVQYGAVLASLQAQSLSLAGLKQARLLALPATIRQV